MTRNASIHLFPKKTDENSRHVYRPIKKVFRIFFYDLFISRWGRLISAASLCIKHIFISGSILARGHGGALLLPAVRRGRRLRGRLDRDGKRTGMIHPF